MYIASVSELVDTFRQGLLALIPVAERAQLAWRKPDAYDDWDELAESLYQVFVRNPASLPGARPEQYPLAPYDYHISSYVEFSWIELTGPDIAGNQALVGFGSGAEPFDTVCLIQVDPEVGSPGPNSEVSWRDHGFVLHRRFVDGSADVVTEVRVDW